MQVYALIGASGTGKSHRASFLAFKYEIPLIIDDGLLIAGTSVLAGKSAKRETTRYGAVKRAIFYDDKHAQEVQEKIKASGAESILVLGTSDKMVLQITKRLDLPAPDKIIRIEEIASQRAISKALELRQKENRHVIPIPTFAIKKEFPGYLIDPLRSFWGKNRNDSKKVVIERSIVRPIYNSFGSNYISEQVIMQMVTHIAAKLNGVSRVGKVEVLSKPEGTVNLQVEVNVFYGHFIPEVLQHIQSVLKEEMEYLTGLTINNIQVTARRIDLGTNFQLQ
ncbi:MAG TPA: Asp23/Gls24 family envelope stress response protein [Oscillospiraceae bacterium]|nr:Asp23/Gls24 family envelope stress response protein [Oscillospiraceae bacterium]